MKLTKSVLVLAVLLVPAVASAQGYYGGGPAPAAQEPGGFHNRQGRLIYGGSVGLGGMSDRFGAIQCTNCDYNPVAVQVEGHLGGFVGPRFALLAEVQANVQTVSSNAFSGDTTTLTQGALMLAGQYWVTPQLWIKGGIGFASLQLDRSYYGDGIVDESSIPENGVAIMGAIGYELLSARYFSVDLQGRLINGSYKQLDNNVTGASVGVGINWY
jgi:hypothetical protein